jgi:hypothetical protein
MLKKYTVNAPVTNPNVRYLKKCELMLKWFKDQADYKAGKEVNKRAFNKQDQLADVLRLI